MIKIYAPASIGNINVGFDVLGLALSPIDGTNLGDNVIIEQSDNFDLVYSGKYLHQLPENPKDNIIYNCWKNFCKIIGNKIPLKITLEKNMPIGSGLGSSACSIVASVVGMNEFFGKPLNKFNQLLLMGKLEGQISGSVHYDNVAPCFLGGLQLILNTKNIISQYMPIFDNWLWIIAYPGVKVSTADARLVLPKNFSKQACIDHSRHLAGFVHAVYTNQSTLAASLMIDYIAEPYRIKLLPDFFKAKKAAKKIGAITFGISGSGPTLFAICDKLDISQILIDWLKKFYIKNDHGFVHLCKVDKLGARKIQ